MRFLTKEKRNPNSAAGRSFLSSLRATSPGVILATSPGVILLAPAGGGNNKYTTKGAVFSTGIPDFSHLSS